MQIFNQVARLRGEPGYCVGEATLVVCSCGSGAALVLVRGDRDKQTGGRRGSGSHSAKALALCTVCAPHNDRGLNRMRALRP